MAILSDVAHYHPTFSPLRNDEPMPELREKRTDAVLFCSTFFYPQNEKRDHFAVWGTDIVEAIHALVEAEARLRKGEYKECGKFVGIRDSRYACA